MILCVNLLWPSKIKSSLILMKNMFNVWALTTNWLKILFLEDLGWIQVFFEKLFISYSCILFIKHCALRSFYIKMLYFSKNNFFQIFDRSNLLLDRLKMRQKIRFESAWLDRCLIGARSIEIDFQSIESNFWSIENRSESFLKCFSHVFITLFILFQKAFSLFFLDRSTLSQFLSFLPNFSQGFCLQVPIRPFYPFFFILFTFFMHFRWNFRTYRFSRFFILDVINIFPMH